MRLPSTALLAAAFAAVLPAAPIDFTTGVITGVYINQARTVLSQGASITTFPVWDYLAASRPYGAQLVPTGSTEKNESFVALGGNRDLGFASAVSPGNLAPEVGVENARRLAGAHIAFARFYTTIKNNTADALEFDYHFTIEPGELTIFGIRDGDTAHLRAGAVIDYVLLSPAGPFGGSYDESLGTLFDLFADVGFDDYATASSNAGMTLAYRDQTILSYVTPRHSHRIALPVIPAYGQLTVYYDMYAHLNVLDNEVGGIVRLGDPGDLAGATPGLIVPRDAAAVPEPASLALIGTGLLALGALARYRSAATRSSNVSRRRAYCHEPPSTSTSAGRSLEL